MSKRAVVNASFVASSVFGMVAAANGYEALTGGDYATEHNQKVEVCADRLGAVATTAARLPVACEDLYDSFDYSPSLDNPSLSGEYILQSAEEFRKKNIWNEADNDSQRRNYTENALAAGLLSLAFGGFGIYVRRKGSEYKLDPNNPLTDDLKKIESTSLDEFSNTYWSFVKRQPE